jgi:hypothetical protein
MPTRLVRYDLATGGSILVEEAISDRGGLVGGDEGVINRAGLSFEAALATLRPAASAVMKAVENLIEGPEEVQLELGFSLKGEVGAVIAKTAAEGSFKLSLKWKPRDKTEPHQSPVQNS